MTNDTLEGSAKSGIDCAARQADQQAGSASFTGPDVPVGSSPPMPRWPLVLSALAWIAWLAFLVLMAVERTASTMV